MDIYIGKIRNYIECYQVSRTIHTALQPRRSASTSCNSFQLTHMPRGNHAQSIASNGDQKEDKTLLQHSQLCQHGEFRHVSVSERQRSRPCGQNLRVPFLERYCHRKSKRALEQWRPTARQKRLYLYHQGEFQHNYFDFVSLHHSDHDGVVRIHVGHSEIVKRLLII